MSSRHSKHAIGIDFGGTTIKTAIVEEGAILERGNLIDTQALGSVDAIMAALVEEVNRLKTPAVTAVGAGLPGFVDSDHGIVHGLTNVPGWVDVPLRKLLTELTGLPAAIDNDANAMTYAEWKHGAGFGRQNVVCMTLGTGVGGGLILNGRLYRGSRLAAGEIGQMSLDMNGVPGTYGNLGALEEYVGNQQITERARKAYARAGRSMEPEECSPAALSTLASQGDKIAIELWKEFGMEIGSVIADIVWLLNPDAVVIGGGVARAGDRLFNPIRDTVKQRTSAVFYESLEIVPATLGNDAGIIGSANIGADQHWRDV
jgi:glucokinase